MGELSLEAVWARYQRAKARRRCLEGLWRDCYSYALPQRGAGLDPASRPGANPAERLFDSTALDAVDQLGASLLAELTPPGSQWFGLVPGREVGAPRARACWPKALERGYPHRAGTFRPFQLRGRDAPGAARPRDRRQCDAAVRGGPLGGVQRVPADGRADERDRLRGRPGRPDRRALPRAPPAPRRASRAVPPRAELPRVDRRDRPARARADGSRSWKRSCRATAASPMSRCWPRMPGGRCRWSPVTSPAHHSSAFAGSRERARSTGAHQ